MSQSITKGRKNMSTETQPLTQTPNQKKSKLVRTDNVRVRRETKKKILTDLAILNKKDFGRKITVDDYVQLAIALVRPEQLERLKEQSLSNRDRMELKYKEYCTAHGKVSKDEYIGILLSTGKGGNG
jgi:hypothetical protein